LKRLQNVHGNLSDLGFVHSNLFNQFFASVEFDPGTAFDIDCGATNDYTDTLGRRWQPDAPYLATSSSAAQPTVFTNIGPITNTLTGDRHLPDACSTANAGSTATSATKSVCPTASTPCCSTSPRTTRPASAPRSAAPAARMPRASAKMFRLAAGVLRTVNTWNATETNDSPNGVPGFGRGVWFVYTPTVSGQIGVRIGDSDPILDTGLSVYRGSRGVLVPIQCHNDGGPVCPGTQASINCHGIAATNYYFLAGGKNGAGGDLPILVTAVDWASTGLYAINPAGGGAVAGRPLSMGWAVANSIGTLCIPAQCLGCGSK
jgi:hypothetical protein